MKRNTTFLTDDQRLQLIDLLHVEACSCVIRNGDVTRIFRERGVKDLYRLLEEEPELLDGAFVADKVVGKGAAVNSVFHHCDCIFIDHFSCII